MMGVDGSHCSFIILPFASSWSGVILSYASLEMVHRPVADLGVSTDMVFQWFEEDRVRDGFDNLLIDSFVYVVGRGVHV
jgi:hypothetical protein